MQQTTEYPRLFQRKINNPSLRQSSRAAQNCATMKQLPDTRATLNPYPISPGCVFNHDKVLNLRRPIVRKRWPENIKRKTTEYQLNYLLHPRCPTKMKTTRQTLVARHQVKILHNPREVPWHMTTRHMQGARHQVRIPCNSRTKTSATLRHESPDPGLPN
jgi:hypothetical protein